MPSPATAPILYLLGRINKWGENTIRCIVRPSRILDSFLNAAQLRGASDIQSKIESLCCVPFRLVVCCKVLVGGRHLPSPEVGPDAGFIESIVQRGPIIGNVVRIDACVRVINLTCGCACGLRWRRRRRSVAWF